MKRFGRELRGPNYGEPTPPPAPPATEEPHWLDKFVPPIRPAPSVPALTAEEPLCGKPITISTSCIRSKGHTGDHDYEEEEPPPESGPSGLTEDEWHWVRANRLRSMKPRVRALARFALAARPLLEKIGKWTMKDWPHYVDVLDAAKEAAALAADAEAKR